MKDSLRDQIRKELEALSAEGDNIIKTLVGAKSETKKKEFNVFQFAARYQQWYTRALRVVTALAPERLREFVSYYEVDSKRKEIDLITYRIQDFLRGIGPTPNPHTGKVPYETVVIVNIAVYNQLTILRALNSGLDSVLASVESQIAAELQDSGLAASRKLLEISPRAAGALAGVVLEDHLQRVAHARGVKIAKKDPTVSDLNDPLKAAEVYDLPTWRRIQFLADIRNLCSHKKSKEPSEAQVQELLDGTAWVIGNIN
jgi:hypothetical protein